MRGLRATMVDPNISLLGKGCTWGDERKNVTAGFIGNKKIVFASKNLY